MITSTDAENIALKKIEEINNSHTHTLHDDEYILLKDKTLSFPQGWMFFWTSKKFYETKNIDFIPLGNGPFFITKSGKMIELPTSKHSSYFIEELDNNGTLLGQSLE